MTFHDSEAVLKRRRSRLAQELKDENVELVSRNERSPGGFVNRRDFEQVMLDEILYARYSPTHERFRTPYGSAVVANCEWLESRLPTAFDPGLSLNVHPIATSGSLEECRPLSDGERTLLIRLPHEPGGLLRVANGDELTIVRLIQELDVGITQRRRDGAVKVFSQDRAYTFDQDEWSVKQFAAGRSFEVAEFLGLPAGSYPDVVRELLEFSFHLLSDRHIGATLVWFVRRAPDGQHPGMAGGFELPADLSLRRPLDHEPLAALLARTDGASLVEPEGRIVKAGTSTVQRCCVGFGESRRRYKTYIS